MTRPVSAVVGIGPGNGAALARRFGADGSPVALEVVGPDLALVFASPSADPVGTSVSVELTG